MLALLLTILVDRIFNLDSTMTFVLSFLCTSCPSQLHTLSQLPVAANVRPHTFPLYLLFDQTLHTYNSHLRNKELLKCFHTTCFVIKHRTICPHTKLTLLMHF